MSPAQPDGQRWPDDGALDPGLVEVEAHRPLSLYVHVPFCRVRCGYCDFNTYTVGFGPGAQVGDYAPSVLAEASLAARVMAESGLPEREARTVFFGGGTPTMLDTAELTEILTGLRERIGIAPGAEVTLEANPDTVTREGLVQLADAGFTRVSFGMQSAVPAILKTLDRTHTPERVPLVVQWAKDAGLSTSVDLIYGTPGENCRPLIRTTRPPSTSWPMRSWVRLVMPGTKSPILRTRPMLTWPRVARPRSTRTRRRTTLPTGAIGTGGAWAPGRILTWDVCAGGTLRTPPRTPLGCARGVPLPTRGRSWMRTRESSNASCWVCAPPRGSNWPICPPLGRLTRPGDLWGAAWPRVGALQRSSRTASSMAPLPSGDERFSRCVAGCSPTM